MTERLGDGLQHHLGRFDAGSTLQKKKLDISAQMRDNIYVR